MAWFYYQDANLIEDVEYGYVRIGIVANENSEWICESDVGRGLGRN